MTPIRPVVLLASASPRRQAMLAAAGVTALVRPTDVVEIPRAGEAPVAFACRMAREKALEAGKTRGEGDPEWVLAGDTVVATEDGILGKPETAAEAAAMLRHLSGRTHEVTTSVVLLEPAGSLQTMFETARVTFRPLTEAEIDAYVDTGEPMDKAGAYGLQGGAGAFVTEVDGAWDAVVGLPLMPLLLALERAGVLPTAEPIARRVGVLRGRIAASCQAARRRISDVCLIAVSKTQPVEAVRAAQRAGLDTFGENYTQEWAGKRASVGSGAVWHFIGRFQRNKARALADHIDAVHTLDSAEGLEALSRAAGASGRRLDVLLQVNLGLEAQKGGVAPDGLEDLCEVAQACGHLNLRGLMAIPPVGPLHATRAHFERLRVLRDGLLNAARPLPWLSMGMSADFDQAILCGSTHIRVGTAIFGDRAAIRPMAS